ncbi:MAG: hypothetical protein QNJ16_05455 [Rhodobacter sp.]|nr:hypothetical protein [Rhodobacter sp.]
MNPLFVSRAGRILYRELPEVHRLYDNRNPDQDKLGDLEAFLYGFGHLLDRFDATLMQFYADGVMDPVGETFGDKAIQGWLVPYVAQLFGVELVAPDPESRRRELSASIWVARRRGTRVAVDTAAELITGLPVVVVPGAARVLRTPSLARRPMMHREITGLWHPADTAILQEPLPAPDLANPFVEGFRASRPNAHAGLPVGTPDTRTAMRAVQGGIERPDAEVRPVNGAGAPGPLTPFTVRARRGTPCFPNTYEDRSLRAPDMRAPRPRRPRLTHLAKPDSVTLFVRPPHGLFTGAELTLAQPTIAKGRVTTQNVPDGTALADVFFDDAAAVVDLNNASADAEGQHVIEDLKFAGTLRVMRGQDVTFLNCAIGTVTGPGVRGGPGSKITARNSAFGTLNLNNLTPAETVAELEFCTVMDAAVLHIARVSDSIMSGSFVALGDGTGEKVGCVRYSLVPVGFDTAHVHSFKTVEGEAQFLRLPCIEREGSMLHDQLPMIGEPGFAVLSDRTAREIATGAEDGGEMGVYHNAWHLARLAAGIAKARQFLPVGQQVFGHYDKRLLAALPSMAE